MPIIFKDSRDIQSTPEELQLAQPIPQDQKAVSFEAAKALECTAEMAAEQITIYYDPEVFNLQREAHLSTLRLLPSEGYQRISRFSCGRGRIFFTKNVSLIDPSSENNLSSLPTISLINFSGVCLYTDYVACAEDLVRFEVTVPPREPLEEEQTSSRGLGLFCCWKRNPPSSQVASKPTYKYNVEAIQAEYCVMIKRAILLAENNDISCVVLPAAGVGAYLGSVRDSVLKTTIQKAIHEALFQAFIDLKDHLTSVKKVAYVVRNDNSGDHPALVRELLGRYSSKLASDQPVRLDIHTNEDLFAVSQYYAQLGNQVAAGIPGSLRSHYEFARNPNLMALEEQAARRVSGYHIASYINDKPSLLQACCSPIPEETLQLSGYLHRLPLQLSISANEGGSGHRYSEASPLLLPKR